MKRPDINLGDKAKDTVTGFEGIVIAICDWLSGCRRITLQPTGLKDGSTIKPETFDAEQVELVTEKVAPVSSPTGGPCPEPTRNEQ